MFRKDPIMQAFVLSLIIFAICNFADAQCGNDFSAQYSNRDKTVNEDWQFENKSLSIYDDLSKHTASFDKLNYGNIQAKDNDLDRYVNNYLADLVFWQNGMGIGNSQLESRPLSDDSNLQDMDPAIYNPQSSIESQSSCHNPSFNCNGYLSMQMVSKDEVGSGGQQFMNKEHGLHINNLWSTQVTPQYEMGSLAIRFASRKHLTEFWNSQMVLK